MHVNIVTDTDTDTYNHTITEEYDVITSRKLLMNFGQFCKNVYYSYELHQNDFVTKNPFC